MKDYIGVKVVAAEPMSRGEYNAYRGWKIPSDENPEDEGYHIRYPDGYESWCPKKQFEEAYRRYDGTKLPSTAILMNSGDYKDRFKAEYKQLVIRYKGLKCMLEKWDNGTLEFKPTCPRSTCNEIISILENINDIGVTLPPFLQPIVSNLKSQVEKKAAVEDINNNSEKESEE